MELLRTVRMCAARKQMLRGIELLEMASRGA